MRKGRLQVGAGLAVNVRCDNNTYHTVRLGVPLGVENMEESTRRDQDKKGIKGR